MGVDAGLLGLAAFLFLLGSIIMTGWRAYVRQRTEPAQKPDPGLLARPGRFSDGGLTQYNWGDAEVALVWWATVGLMLRIASLGEGTDSRAGSEAAAPAKLSGTHATSVGLYFQYRYRYARGIACLVVTATLAMSIPWLLKQAVEGIEHGRPVREIASTLLLIIGIALLQGIVRSFSRFLIFNVGRDIEYQLRNELFAHLQTLSLSYYQRQPIGDLMSRLVNDVTAVRLLLGLGIINILNTPLYYVYAMSAMLAMDPILTLLAVTPYPFMFVLVRAMSRQLMQRTLNVQAGLADLSSRVQESVSGMPVIRAYVREAWQNRVFAGLNERFKIENIALARLRSLFPPLMKGVSGTGLLVVLWYGGSQVIAGQLSLGDLVAFMGYLHLLAWPTMAMGWLISLYQRGKAAMQRLEVIWQTRPDIVDGTGNGARRNEPAVRGEIGFRHVDFAYPTNGQQTGQWPGQWASTGQNEPILHDITFTVPAGKTVAIVGSYGSGQE